MQNRYAGDIGDYSKFVLMKHLFEDKDIGIVWYLYPDETHNKDGLHIEYGKYGLTDSVKEILKNVANSKNRNIDTLMEALYKEGYLDGNRIKEFKDLVSVGENMQERCEHRTKWHKRAQEAVKGCPVVFVDPDNGLVKMECYGNGHKKSGKYIFFHEAGEFFEDAKVLIIYQHFPRKKHIEFIEERLEDIKREIPGDYGLYAIKFNKVSPRVYFVLVEKDAKKEFEKNLKEFFESDFSRSKDGHVFAAYDAEGRQLYPQSV